MALLPACQIGHNGRAAIFKGLGAPPAKASRPALPPAIERVIQKRGAQPSAAYNVGPYQGMTWGPPVKYVEIPPGEAGTRATLKIMKELVLSPWGHRNPEVIWIAKNIVQNVSPGPSKDYRAMVERILKFMKTQVKYELDPAGLEYVQTPHYTLATWGSGDCFVQGTKVLLRAGHRLVPIESLREGDEIWGYQRWSKVTRVWGDKGILRTHRINLNNGSSMRLTPDHKVWIARCERHANRGPGNPCSCRLESRDFRRVTVGELEPGMVLVQPDSIPFGEGEMDPRRALIEGLYLSEGWSEEGRFSVSALDGGKKQWIRDEVMTACLDLGIPFSEQRKHVRVNDKEWAKRLALMGKRAPVKSALSINLQESVAREFLRGIMADSGENTNGNGRTFTTTSYDLWLQTRTLLKMQGLSCSSRYVVDHGGLGTNPIWRLGVRDQTARKAPKLLKVKSVDRDEVEARCFDIETDDHFVWLPEADWTVSQCDDHATAIAALAMALGFKAGFRTVKGDKNRPDQWSHVYAVVGIEKNGKTQWLTVDSTQPESHLEWDPPEGRTLGMKTWVIDPSLERTSWHS